MHSTTPPPSTWLGRNWKWCVPVVAALLLALFAAFIFGILALVFGALKSSGPYQQAMARAQADPAVGAALGTPIQAGWLVQGNFSSNGPDGEANLAIPLDGAKADGTLFVVAKKHAGEWRYETLAVNVDGGERIVLEGGTCSTASAP